MSCVSVVLCDVGSCIVVLVRDVVVVWRDVFVMLLCLLYVL